MIGFDELDIMIDPVIELYQRFVDSVIKNIAIRMSRLAYNSAAWQMQRLVESGVVYEDALQEISDLNGQSVTELHKLFKQMGVANGTYDNRAVRRAGLEPLRRMSPAAWEVLKAGLARTAGTLQNLSAAIPLAGQQAFIRYTDLAHMQVSSGAMDYNSAMKMAVGQLLDEGLQFVNYTGHRDRADVAVRRALLTGVGQVAGDLTLQNVKDLGTDLVEVSAHIGARNKGEGPENHESWQGKVYSLSGTGKYPDFYSSTGYGTGEGLLGWNCRHTFFPYFEGAERNYHESDLAAMRKKVTYNGKTMTFYDATQLQRKMERRIREEKRKAQVMADLGFDNVAQRAKIREYQAKLRDFTKQTGLWRQPVREQVENQPIPVVNVSDVMAGMSMPEPGPASVESPEEVRVPNPKPKPVVIEEFDTSPVSAMQVAKSGIPEGVDIPQVEYRKELHVKGGLAAEVSNGLKMDEDPNRVLGIFDSTRMKTKDGHWVIRKLGSPYDIGDPVYESLAYDMDQMLGTNVVPDTFTDMTIDKAGYRRSYQLYVKDAVIGRDATAKAYGDGWEESIGNMRLLDIVIGNIDRNGGNWLMKYGRAVAIDHGMAFSNVVDSESDIVDMMVGNWKRQTWPLRGSGKDYSRVHVSSGMRDRLLELYLSEAFQSFGKGVLEQSQIDAMLKRVKVLLSNWDKWFY